MCQELNTIKIKGKAYVQVNERLNYFRNTDMYSGWSLVSEIIALTDSSATVKAVIADETGRVRATGLASEEKNSSEVNVTSFVENAETSAWGRALANLGIGIITSVASADEVNNAIKQQNAHKNNDASQTIHDLNTNLDLKIGQIVPFGTPENSADYKCCYSSEKNSYFFALKNPADINRGFQKYIPIKVKED